MNNMRRRKFHNLKHIVTKTMILQQYLATIPSENHHHHYHRQQSITSKRGGHHWVRNQIIRPRRRRRNSTNPPRKITKGKDPSAKEIDSGKNEKDLALVSKPVDSDTNVAILALLPPPSCLEKGIRSLAVQLVQQRCCPVGVHTKNVCVKDIWNIINNKVFLTAYLMFRCQFRLGFPVKIEISLFCVVFIFDNVFP
ncbi:uncharacterized protein LOC129768813 [Toxorhynchites rutilus septentrionalis]|uniref:uncharacterized protein LOC129768813 n=1 Tax=Toxorhynchites rutilus septentrionalis TaxID=329112 RepID=UPI002479234A|nr:uncharacterized protein LOC129768813 [Toxorhynchites rutilus septentrionalis]XP_055626686.1 uncharacterized protein LOC129768813 [Toxorhynchites rutilus septentrionalis]XP_055626687.1 uncharacterized protein LOC129768813 [Toxorhynchites rutilus septentrionalis]